MDAHLVQVLEATLSSSTEERRAAEQALDELLADPDAALALTRLGLSTSLDLSTRQLAGVILHKHLARTWETLSPESTAIPESHRPQLLELLFSGLALPESKLRSQFAHALAVPLLAQASSPGVLDALLGLLARGTHDQVHGAMAVFREVVRKGELDLGEVAGGGNEGDARVLAVVRALSPVLLGVLGNETHSSPTRAATITVFRQCLSTLYMLKDVLPQEANAAVADVLPGWLEACVTLLQGDIGLSLREGGRPAWETLLIKREVFKTLTTIHRSFPRMLTSSILTTHVLPLSTAHLAGLLPLHTLYAISSTSDATPPPPATDDSAGDEPTIEQVVSPLLDLLTELTRAGKLKAGWTTGNDSTETDALASAVLSALGFSLMTTDDEEEWANDPNAFAADEDDETDLYSLRVACHDFIATLLEKYPRPSARVLQSAVQWRIGASEIEQKRGDVDWWKGLEASLACVGGVSEPLLELLETEETKGGKKSFDLGFLFDRVIPKFLGAQELPFLQGRSFVVASQYATALSPSLAAQYLEAAVQVLEAEGMGVSVKISAVKTIKNFCRHLPPTTVQPLSHRILSTLVPLLTQAGDEVLALVLESLRAVVGVDEAALDPQLMAQLSNVLLDVWAKNASDPIIASIFEELFEHLASTPKTETYDALVSHALPKICSAVTNPPGDDAAAAATLAAGAIELVCSLLRGREGPLDPEGKGYVAGIASVLFPGLLHGEDMEMIQNGVEALTLLIRKDCQSLIESIDPQTNQSGLHSTFAVIARLLRPGESESRGLFLGDLVVHLLRRAPSHSIAPVLPDLVRAMVERIPTAMYQTFQQSLIIPLAYLLETQFEGTLKLLEETPITVAPVPPSTESTSSTALAVLLRSWSENAETFQGSWAIRVSTLALGRLFVESARRESLSGLGVRGEQIVDQETNGLIMTRSMTKSRPIRYSQIPFPLKALKLILSEMRTVRSAGEYNALWDAEDDDDDDDDGDDDDGDNGAWEDDGPGLVKGRGPAREDEFGFLSDMMGPGGIDDADASFGGEDEDLRDDPVSTIDLNAHLAGVLRTSYAEMDGFGRLVAGLSDEERGVLGGVLA